MTSQAKIEANRRNSLKSTGPNTPEGRSKSSMNALKHGMRSKRLAFLREDSFAFENRRQKWMASADPDDDAGEYLVHQYVCLSFELDQVERAHLEHFTSLIENADESELDAVHDLGKRLLFDPTGPTPLYGNPPDGRRKRTTSSNGLPVDPNDPALSAQARIGRGGVGVPLDAQSAGRSCAQLGPGKFWQSHDRLKAIRLLGRQPLDAIEDRRVAEIFVASHALNPVGHGPFDDLLSDMHTSQLVRYRKAVKARWPDLVTADEPARCRELLIELADRNIERLNAKLEVHEQNADANARRTVDRLGFDQGRDGERIRAYKLKCRSGFFRAIEAYRKHQAKKRAEGRERTDEYAPLTAKDRARRPGDASRWAAGIEASYHVPDGAFARENLTNEANFDESMITIQNEEQIEVTAESAVDSGLDKPQEQPGRAEAKCDRVSDGSFVGEDGEREVLQQSTDSDALPDPGAQPNGDGMSPRGANHQNDTNEPKFDETVIIIQNKEPVGVMANSGVDSGPGSKSAFFG